MLSLHVTFAPLALPQLCLAEYLTSPRKTKGTKKVKIQYSYEIRKPKKFKVQVKAK